MNDTQVWIGAAILIGTLVVLAAGYILHMKSVLESCVDDKAEQIADRRFNEMLETAEIRVHQKMYLVYGKGYEDV